MRPKSEQLTRNEWDVLYRIRRGEATTQYGFGRFYGPSAKERDRKRRQGQVALAESSVREILDKLEKEGYVTAEEERFRGKKEYSLTEKGGEAVTAWRYEGQLRVYKDGLSSLKSGRALRLLREAAARPFGVDRSDLYNGARGLRRAAVDDTLGLLFEEGLVARGSKNNGFLPVPFAAGLLVSSVNLYDLFPSSSKSRELCVPMLTRILLREELKDSVAAWSRGMNEHQAGEMRRYLEERGKKHRLSRFELGQFEREWKKIVGEVTEPGQDPVPRKHLWSVLEEKGLALKDVLEDHDGVVKKAWARASAERSRELLPKVSTASEKNRAFGKVVRALNSLMLKQAAKK